MEKKDIKRSKVKINNQDSSNGHIALSKSIAKTNEQPLAKGESVGSNPIPDAKRKQNIILDLCGGTGSWSEPFKKRGFRVIIVDIKTGYDIKNCYPTNDGEIILKGNDGILKIKCNKIYGILSAPPCPMFSFCRTNAKEKRDLDKAFYLVERCLWIVWACQKKINKDTQKKSPLKFWALENPNGMLKWFLGKPALEFSPYEYGDNYKKKTHIWGYFNIPKKIDRFENLKEIATPEALHSLIKFDRMLSKDIHPEYYGKLTRQERRAITPKGFAEAFCKANC